MDTSADAPPTDPSPGGGQHRGDRQRVRRAALAAIRALDGPQLRDLLLTTLRREGVEWTVVSVMAPVLRDVGDAWEVGDLAVVHEHFVSNAFRGVLGALPKPAVSSTARSAVLACPPQERHDLPVELFGAVLRERGWQVVNLGADTPLTALSDAVRVLHPDACVLASTRASAFEARLAALTALATRVPLFLAGEGTRALTTGAGRAVILPRDLRTGADTMERMLTPSAERTQPLG